jgi:integrase/recombinase XerD
VIQEQTQDMAAAAAIAAFLAELARTNRSPATQRAYAHDLQRFSRFYQGSLRRVTSAVLRQFLQTLVHLSPASRCRQEAALASWLRWAYRQDLIDTLPMAKLDRVHRDPPVPRGLPRAQIETILEVIPSTAIRDRLLFRLLLETGLRVGEALTVYVEDLDLTPDDEHVQVRSKGGRRRTVLLDEPRLVQQLRRYLQRTGYRYGPLFRATKNGRGGPLRYQSVHAHWQHYCRQAGVRCTLHQLRHTHATELMNAGVSLATIRKRLGHKQLQTTLRYAEQSDATADAEVRAWRRRQVSLKQ